MYFRHFRAVTLLVTGVTALFLYSFSKGDTYTETAVLKRYTLSFGEAVARLDQTAQHYKYGRVTQDSLQSAVLNTRLAYKKVEFYLAFHFPEYTKDHFNGAPLLQIEKEGTRPKVITPEGLQVLDEMAFGEQSDEVKVQLAATAKKLHSYFIDLNDGIGTRDMKGVYGTSAMRMQLIRIFSLGVTGFDTPGSLNALPEAKASLQGMKQFYEENYTKTDPVSKLFIDAISYLDKNNDFNTFNRLAFFTQYIDPLYRQLGESQGRAPEFLTKSSAWNTQSKSIFAEDFLNPYFYTNVTRAEDTPELRELGRALFYDTALSQDGKVSCASCHNPDLGFTDGVAKSASNVQGKTVLRNAPTLLNAAYADRYFYDLRAYTLEQQAEHVIFNPDEFNTAYSAILKKLAENPQYAAGFKKAFGKKGMNRENFSKALASYIISLKSFNSPMDKYLRGESNNISSDVKAGFNLFTGKAACATCHFAPTFSGLVPPLYSENESEILGVLANPNAAKKAIDSDNGRIENEVYTEYAWIYEKSFKTSTVRNAEVTAPYFHNGAYKTLEEVIEFYNEGGGEGLGFSVKNQTLAPDKLQLTEPEKKQLIAFIKSLTDTSAARPH